MSMAVAIFTKVTAVPLETKFAWSYVSGTAVWAPHFINPSRVKTNPSINAHTKAIVHSIQSEGFMFSLSQTHYILDIQLSKEAYHLYPHQVAQYPCMMDRASCSFSSPTPFSNDFHGSSSIRTFVLSAFPAEFLAMLGPESYPFVPVNVKSEVFEVSAHLTPPLLMPVTPSIVMFRTPGLLLCLVIVHVINLD